MSKTWRWFVVVAALLMTGGLAGAAWLHWSRPTVLKVAVGPSGFADAELMAAFSRTLSSNSANVQLTVEHTAGPSEAVGKLIGKTKALPLSPPAIIASIRQVHAHLNIAVAVQTEVSVDGVSKRLSVRSGQRGGNGPYRPEPFCPVTTLSATRVPLTPSGVGGHRR